MKTEDIDKEALPCEACGGSGLKTLGCNLLPCPVCEGEGIKRQWKVERIKGQEIRDKG